MSNPPEPPDTLTAMMRQAGNAVTRDGNVLVFTAIGAMALAGALLDDWSWEREEVEGLPQVRDESGRRFAYKLLRGGRFVEIFLPTGRRAEHRVTPLAGTDAKQLEAEVFAIVTDNYPSTT